MQYDAAAIASVGRAKRPGSPVAGRASIFIFPDLDTGNTTYKVVPRSAQVVSKVLAGTGRWTNVPPGQGGGHSPTRSAAPRVGDMRSGSPA